MHAITRLRFGRVDLPEKLRFEIDPVDVTKALQIADSKHLLANEKAFTESHYPGLLFIYTPRPLSLKDFNAVFDRGIFYIGAAYKPTEADHRLMAPLTFAGHDTVHATAFLRLNFPKVFNSNNNSLARLAASFKPSDAAYSYIANRLQEIGQLKASFYEAALSKDCPVNREVIEAVWFYLSHEHEVCLSWDNIDLLSKKIVSLNDDQFFQRGKPYFDRDIGPHDNLINSLRDLGYTSDEAIRETIHKTFSWLDSLASKQRTLPGG
jgi:hypothetical protein